MGIVMTTECPIQAEIDRNLGRFYVYILSYPDGIPFYVGCGSATEGRHGYRILDHEAQARTSHRSFKCSVIRKIWKAGGEIKREIDSWYDDKEGMFAREVSLIAEIGRKDTGLGTLTNCNDGGTGGFNPSEETRAAMRKAHIGRWTAERREEQGRRASEMLLSDPIKNARFKQTWTQESRDAHANRVTEIMARADVKEKKSIATEQWFADPTRRMEHSARIKACYEERPEIKEALSSAQKKNWSDPAYRESHMAKRVGRKLSPEHKQRISEGVRRTFAARNEQDNSAA